MRLRANAPVPTTRTAKHRVLVAAVLSTAGLAALPVAVEVDDAEPELGTALPATATIGALEGAPAEVPTDEADRSEIGLDRFYSPEEADELAPEPEPETVEVTPADEEQPEPAEEPVDDAPADATPERSRWDRLADCESGEWVDGGASFVEGSARWDYGVNFAHEGYEQFQGGLNFEASTWDAFRDPGMPEHAGHATREQQILVGERVLAQQGWQAWPRCSQMVGLR